MSLQLLAHPFSSYCQKVLIALYENDTPFEFCPLSQEHPEHLAALEFHWPIKRFPVLIDDGKPVVEASIIVEHLGLHHPGPVSLLPADPKAALRVRTLDRFFDNYIATPQQKVVFDALRPANVRDARGVEEARAMLETAYRWLDDALGQRDWAAGEAFSLADCGAAPFLFYGHWTHPIPARHGRVHAYLDRLLGRASVRRVIDEARPFRSYFPLGGAPAKDAEPL